MQLNTKTLNENSIEVYENKTRINPVPLDYPC